MGLWNLFKGYAFFKLLSIGIGMLFFGILITILAILEFTIFYTGCGIVFFLIGFGALYIAYGIWKGESEERSDYFGKRYYRDRKPKECTRCGAEEMMVDFDGHAECSNCGHETDEYYKEAGY
ncbi:MAG: hypothetical protein ACOC53_00390 [Candidatus Saliniplasma sp.]